MSYAWEKLHLAIHSLAGAGTQQDRLANAGLDLINLQARDFPKELQDDFFNIKNRMTCVSAQGDEGALVATVRALDELAISSLVTNIISLHDAITRRCASYA